MLTHNVVPKMSLLSGIGSKLIERTSYPHHPDEMGAGHMKLDSLELNSFQQKKST